MIGKKIMKFNLVTYLFLSLLFQSFNAFANFDEAVFNRVCKKKIYETGEFSPEKKLYCEYLSKPEARLVVKVKDGSTRELAEFSNSDASKGRCGLPGIAVYDEGYFPSCMNSLKSYMELGKITLIVPKFTDPNLPEDCFRENPTSEIIIKCVRLRKALENNEAETKAKTCKQECEEINDQYVVCNTNTYLRATKDNQSLRKVLKKMTPEEKTDLKLPSKATKPR
jgi:hypothetical protein